MRNAGPAAILQEFPVQSSQECRQCLDALDASTLNGQACPPVLVTPAVLIIMLTLLLCMRYLLTCANLRLFWALNFEYTYVS